MEEQEKIRRAIVTAMFSDDDLFEHLVLKGGNALRLVHGLGGRTSLDLDFSVERDLEEVAELKQLQHRMVRVLEHRLTAINYVPFDAELERRPSSPPAGPWGGYELRFKVISQEKYAAHRQELSALRRQAQIVGANQHRIWKVQISKHEYCGSKMMAMLDSFQVQVYTPAMIALEKVRALCQQMPEYTQTAHPRPRARDFYDIWTVVAEAKVELASPESLELCRLIFSAKQVPLGLIPQIRETREFHRPDWSDVENSVAGTLKPFDKYFDFVVEKTKGLKPLWNE